MKRMLLLTVLGVCAAAAQTPVRPSFADSTARTRDVATRYYNHYFSLALDSMASLMHPDISFEDPTARFIFNGGRYSGKDSVLLNTKRLFKNISDVTTALTRSIVSANTALFETTLRWAFVNSAGKKIFITTPLVVVLTVSGGRVIEHRDYGDYSTFRQQYEAQK